MKAVVWGGTNRVSVETVPDPTLLLPTDAIVRVSSTAICGSDLHLLDGRIPSMEKGDILGHDFMPVVCDLSLPVSGLLFVVPLFAAALDGIGASEATLDRAAQSTGAVRARSRQKSGAQSEQIGRQLRCERLGELQA